jgi:hypothetical protein
MRDRISLGAWLLAAAVGLLLAAGPAGAEDAYRLAYRWSAGDQVRYSVYIVGRIEASGEPAQDIKLRRQSVWEITAAGPDQDRFTMMETAVNQSGPDVDLRAFGLPSPAEPIQRAVDSLGRVAGVTHYTEGSRFYLLPLVFDPKPVAAGAKWTVTAKLEPGAGAAETSAAVKVEYTLEKVVARYKLTDHNCAIIRVSAEYNSGAADGSAGLSGDFSGKAVFDLLDQKIIDYQLTDHRKEWIQANNWTRTSTVEVTALEQK